MPYLSQDVFEGDDDHLFLVGGTNNVQRLFTEPDHAFLTLCANWRTLLSTRKQIAQEKRIRDFHCFVPDKLSVLREKASAITTAMRFPAEALESDSDPLLLDILVPLTAYLRKQSTSYSVFHKTDTHWTIEGCFSAYQMLCYYLRIPQNADLIHRPAPAVQGSWDLGSKVIPTRLETIRFGRFAVGASRTNANYLVTAREAGIVPNKMMLHVGSIVEYHNNREPLSSSRLLVFGDSFFEYRPHMLTGMFAETVTTVMFVWSSSIDWGLVDEFKPDILLTEIAERFMRVVPNDDVDIRRHAAMKLESAMKL
jgi:alginate O-acetyltransferase complex protein AlgJ